MIYIDSNTILIRLKHVVITDVIKIVNRFTDIVLILDITNINDSNTYSEITFSNPMPISGTYNLYINDKLIDLCSI